MAGPAVIVEFLAETQKLTAGVKDLQKTGEQASKGWDWKRVAKWGAAAAAIGGASAVIKSAVSDTEDLAKSTLALSRTTGMDVKTSSEWVSVLKERGINVSAFQRGLVTLSKQMEAAAGGSKKSTQAFKELGVSMEDVRKGNTQKVIMELSDGLAKMTNPARRAALTQQFFSRTGQQLAPILYKGSQAIQEQLDTAAKYGATLDGKSTKSVASLIARQREMQLAMEGAKIQLGTALIPVLLAFSGILVQVTRVMQPLLTNGTLLKGVIVALTVAFVAYKAAVVASTIASLELDAAMLPVIAIAAGIVVGIAALIAISYELYKHWDALSKLAGTVWDAIKKGAETAINWLKSNWPLLLGVLGGPFALAVVLIAKHWNAIVEGAKAAGRAIKSGIVNALDGIGAAAWDVINNIGAVIVQFAKTIVGWGSSLAGWIKSAVVSGLDGIGIAAWNVVNNIGAVIVQFAKTIVGWGTTIGSGIKSGFEAGIHGLTEIFKAAINAVFKLWNGITIPGIHIKVLGHKISTPDIPLPNIPLLATGGIVTGPTLAVLGERGPEAVLPLGRNGSPVEVHVYIGETELRGIVKSEVRTADNRTAQVLLAGAV